MAKRRKGADPGTQPFGFALPATDWRPPKISELPSWQGVSRIGYDLETKDTDLETLGPGVRRPGNFIAGLSFAFEDGPSFYVPIRHEGGDNVEDPEQALRYFRDQAKNYDGEIAGMNLGYEIDWSAQEGIEFPKVRRWRDIQNAAVLHDELHQSYKLANILERLGMPGKDETVLKAAARAYGYHPKKDLWRMPARYSGAYGTADAARPLAALRKLEAALEDDGIWEAYELESRLLPVLIRMRRRGVRIDEDHLERVEQWSLAQEAEACREIHRLTGRQLGIGECFSPAALAPILSQIGACFGKTETGRDSLDQEVLEGCGEVGALLIRCRKMFKLRNTYTSNIRDHTINGRLHTTLNQMARESDKKSGVVGARWGRMSSSDPNLQNQPSRDEYATFFKKAFLPEEGTEWGSHDYRRQEPKLIVHYAIKHKCTGWSELQQLYVENPNIDEHRMMAELTGLERKHAKNIYMGLCYGEGEVKLCRECGFEIEYVTRREAAKRKGWKVFGDPDEIVPVAGAQGRHVFDTFHSRAPFIGELTDKSSKFAKRNGYITLIDGRRCHFPLKKNGTGYDWTHKALNRVIQGGAAVQTKKAVIEADAAGHFLQLVVHDDLTASVSGREESDRIAKIMENVIALNVPSSVEYKTGPSWGELEAA